MHNTCNLKKNHIDTYFNKLLHPHHACWHAHSPLPQECMVCLGLWKGLCKEESPEPGPKPRQSGYNSRAGRQWFTEGFPHIQSSGPYNMENKTMSTSQWETYWHDAAEVFIFFFPDKYAQKEKYSYTAQYVFLVVLLPPHFKSSTIPRKVFFPWRQSTSLHTVQTVSTERMNSVVVKDCSTQQVILHPSAQ